MKSLKKKKKILKKKKENFPRIVFPHPMDDFIQSGDEDILCTELLKKFTYAPQIMLKVPTLSQGGGGISQGTNAS